MESATEDDGKGISLEETLESLKRNAKAVDIYFYESRNKLKVLQKKVAQESHDLAEIPLQPTTKLMKWLTDRGLPVESSFRDFLEAFLEEHGKKDLLDLSTRTVRLNESACTLFGVKQNTVLDIYDLLTRTQRLYL